MNIGTAAGFEEARGVIQNTIGDIFIAGMTNGLGAGGNDALLMRMSPDGNMIFAKTFGVANNDVFNAITETTNGNIVAAGSSNDATNNDMMLVSVDTNGSILWQKHILLREPIQK